MRKTIQNSFADLTIASMISPDDPLKILFDSIDFSFIYKLCESKYHSVGRQGYNPQSLFKALLLIYLGYASSERDLAKRLMFDGRLCYLCGFSYGNTPRHNTFHYFRERLGEETFHEILLNLIAQALCLVKSKNLKLSIDSSHIEAFPSDKEAQWGYKSKDFSFYGYKVHLEVTTTPLPIAVSVKVTEANKWDGHFLSELTDSARKEIEKTGKTIKAVIADAGYDSTDNAKYLLQQNITPYIAENPRSRKNCIDTGLIKVTKEGKLLCPGNVELCYWGKEHKRGRVKFRCGLFRQKGEGCLFRQLCFQKSEYGPTFYFKEDMDIQNVMRAIRSKKTFKEIYKRRTVVERFFNVLKGVHKLCELRFRGLSKVSSHVFLSLSAYLSRVIVGLKAGGQLIAV